MTAPIDTVSWCAPERFHQPLTVSFTLRRPNWKAACGETRLRRLERGKGRKTLPIAIAFYARLWRKMRALSGGKGLVQAA